MRVERGESSRELPPGLDPRRVFAVLQEKARDPRPFVPRITEVRVLAEREDGFDREITLFGVRIRERIRVADGVVRFDREAGPWAGWLVNGVGGGRVFWSFAVSNPAGPTGSPPLGVRYPGVMDAVLARAGWP